MKWSTPSWPLVRGLCIFFRAENGFLVAVHKLRELEFLWVD